MFGYRMPGVCDHSACNVYEHNPAVNVSKQTQPVLCTQGDRIIPGFGIIVILPYAVIDGLAAFDIVEKGNGTHVKT